MMNLYHGSNASVAKPELLDSLRGLDFGKGFYTTSNFEQAVRFSESVVRRRKIGVRTVSVYEIDQNSLFSDCSHIKFMQADEKWLDFVAQNRSLAYSGAKYDLVIGPVANDVVFNVIDLYIDGILDREEAIKRLKVRRLYDQWTFCSSKALSFLKFIEPKIIE